jgi:hypothetical protein
MLIPAIKQTKCGSFAPLQYSTCQKITALASPKAEQRDRVGAMMTGANSGEPFITVQCPTE